MKKFVLCVSLLILAIAADAADSKYADNPDTGFKQSTVWDNSQSLQVDLSGVNQVVLTHYHTDHVGGLLHLRRQLMHKYPQALSRVFVGKYLLAKAFFNSAIPKTASRLTH